jgi:RimJ/RimL family protein N-acetyltransferase
MAPVTLETARLTLRPLGGDDLDALVALHSEEAFWRHPLGRAMTPEETTTFLERTVAHYDDHGFGLSAVVLRDSGTLAGWAGLAVPNFLPELLPAVEVGWRLGERFWGQGYATEAGAAWVGYGLGELGLERICQPENEASYAVMMRIGMRFERRTVDPLRGFSLLVTEIAVRASDATPDRDVECRR